MAIDSFVKLDMKGLKKIRRKLIKAAETSIQVGFFDGVPHPNAPEHTIAEIGAIQEFGLPSQNIPERPFITSAVRNTTSELTLAVGVRRFLAGAGTIQAAKRKAGNRLRDEISLTIIEFSSPGNAPQTIEKKGFDNPLIETGTLSRSVKVKIGPRR